MLEKRLEASAGRVFLVPQQNVRALQVHAVRA